MQRQTQRQQVEGYQKKAEAATMGEAKGSAQGLEVGLVARIFPASSIIIVIDANIAVAVGLIIRIKSVHNQTAGQQGTPPRS